MRCGTSRRLISRYQDGELGNWRRRRLERHFESCLVCRAELEADKRIWALLDAAEVVEAPEVMSRFEGRLGEPETVAWRHSWRLSPIAYAAAVVLFAVAGSLGGVFVAARRLLPAEGAPDPEYAGFLEEIPPGLAPIASMFQPERTP